MGLAQWPTEIIPSSCPWPRLNRLSRSQPPPSPAFFPLPPRLAFASIILSSLAPRHKPTPPPHTNAHARPLRERQTGDAHRSIGRKKKRPRNRRKKSSRPPPSKAEREEEAAGKDRTEKREQSSGARVSFDFARLPARPPWTPPTTGATPRLPPPPPPLPLPP